MFTLLLLAATVSSSAQTSGSDAFSTEVRKCVKLQRMAETMTETMRLQLQTLVQQGTLTETNLNVFSKEITAVMLPMLQKRLETIYRKNFTLEEMRQLNAYLSSPVGQKVIDLTPMLAAEGAKVAQSAEMQEKIQTILMKYINK